MYTIDDQRKDLYEDEYYEDSNWDNRKGLVFKIIIIILCIIVLIWLIKALKSNNNLTDNGEVHTANVEKIRLAAENYFFINNKKDTTNYVRLLWLKSEGLIGNVVDANNKTCSDMGTGADLNVQDGVYKMTVKLDCSTNDQNEVFYYHYNTLACLNCTGKTNMTGTDVVIAKADEKEEKEEVINVNNNTRDNNDEYKYYSCASWSDWSKERVYDKDLTERVKTLVTGAKYSTKITYGEWSEYTTTPIIAGEGIEVETKTVTENAWSENKTGTNINTNSQDIKVISSTLVDNTDIVCPDGYMENDICYSNETTIGNLTLKEYNSGNYKIEKQYCEGVKNIKNKDGLYVITYVNCKYNEVKNPEEVNTSYVLYTYQKLSSQDVVYYRYRTVTKIDEPVEYTEKKYVENELPEGFVKVPGTEENYYSYKLTECIK